MPTAIENKLYEPSRELNFQAGILPLDAFYKALLLNLGYTHYYASYSGWEIFNASVAFSTETSLRDDLRNNFSVRESRYLDYVKYTVSTNYVYTPIYNKNLWFNEKVVHGEISFVGGGGMAAFKSGKTAPMAGGGVILRFFSSDRWSYKFDNRIYYHAESGMNTNFILSLSVGLSYDFDPGGKERRRMK
ncbi:MAG: outer membrane beta-barrel domain-containing protein [Bdellovibrionales bacterium]